MTKPTSCSTRSTAHDSSWLISRIRSRAARPRARRGPTWARRGAGSAARRPPHEPAPPSGRGRSGAIRPARSAHGGEPALLQHVGRPARGAPARARRVGSERRSANMPAAAPAPLERGEHVVAPPRASRTSAPAGTCGAARCGPGGPPTTTSRRGRRTGPCRSFGVRTPEMTSNSVVLPAPFGPMSPQTSPAPTASETSVRAAMPPKRTLTPSSTRMGDAGVCPSGRGGRDRRWLRPPRPWNLTLYQMSALP